MILQRIFIAGEIVKSLVYFKEKTQLLDTFFAFVIGVNFLKKSKCR